MTKKLEILEDLLSAINKFSERQKKLTALSKRFSFYRLGIFLIGITLFLVSFFFISELSAWIFLTLSILSFGIIAGTHNKINRGTKRNDLWIKIKRIQSAKIRIDWNNIPPSEFILPDENHPFEADLNITGKFSLHRLINSTVSVEGSTLLRDWLISENPSADEIKARQDLIKEFIHMKKFRNKLILNCFMASSARLNSSRFNTWLGSGNDINKLRKIISILWIIIPVNIILFILFITGFIPPVFSIGLLAYTAFYFFNLNLIRDSFDNALYIEGELGKFFAVLGFLESYPYKNNSLLKKFCSPFTEKESPSNHFKRIKNIINALSFQKNPLTAIVLNIVFPWDFYFTLKLEKEKEALSVNLNEWMDTWHKLEALNSLAEFGYLNPEYVFPVLNSGYDEMVLNVKQTGHPLIPFSQNKKNDFSINSLGEITIITGSNMSGKSTFLKSLGTNIVLAYAGAPVNASEFNISLFRLFTCIKISDSVTDGISYFYAEVKRLKELLNRLEYESKQPLFFLIDEIFRGTNNIERLTGSRAYIKALTGKKGTGLVSTHDLELVKIEQESVKVRNYHFREETAGNKMIFDYQLRPGPCPTTNALKIMEIEGLPIN